MQNQKQQTNQSTDKKTDQDSYFRFAIFLSARGQNKVTKGKTVGMAYLRNGQQMYTLKLWMHSLEKYFLLPSREDASKYLIMTREPNRTLSAKNKYFWNIVGNAKSHSDDGVIELCFDLLKEPLYMSFFPESSVRGHSLPNPEEVLDAA